MSEIPDEIKMSDLPETVAKDEINSACGYKCGKCCKGCCTMEYECCTNKVGDYSQCGCSPYTSFEAIAGVSGVSSSLTFMTGTCVLCCSSCGACGRYTCMYGSLSCWQGAFIAAGALAATAASFAIGACLIKFYCQPMCGTNAAKCGCANFAKGYED